MSRVATLSEKFRKNSNPDVLRGHEKKVVSTSWNESGDLLASGSMDMSVRLWSLKEGRVRESAIFRDNKHPLGEVMFSPTDRNLLATITDKKSMLFFDVRSGKRTNTITTEGSNISMGWSPDGRYIAVGNKSDVLLFVDTKKGEIVKRQKFNYEINQIKWDVESRFLMATNQSRSRGAVQVMKMDASSDSSNEGDFILRTVNQMLGHTANCFAIEVDPSGKYLASGSSDAMVCIWNTSDLTCSSAINRMEWPVTTLSFSYDGSLLASGSEDAFIDIADTKTGARVWKQESKGMIYSLSWHPKALLLAYTHDAPSQDSGANVIKLIGV